MPFVVEQSNHRSGLTRTSYASQPTFYHAPYAPNWPRTDTFGPFVTTVWESSNGAVHTRIATPQPRPVARLCNVLFGANIQRDSIADITMHAVFVGINISALVHFLGAPLGAGPAALTAAYYIIGFVYHVVADDGVLNHLQN